MSLQDALNESAEQTSAAAGPGGLAGWLEAPAAFVRARPRFTLVLVAAALLTAGGMVAGWGIYRAHKLEPLHTAAAALELIDQADYEAAKQLAETVVQRTENSAVLAAAEYVLGVVAFQEAAKAPRASRKTLFLVAARYLEAALSGGLDEDRRGEAWWLLGRARYEAGEMASSQAAFVQALAAQPHRAAEVRPLLVEAYLRDSPPKLAKALEQNKLILAEQKLPEFQRVAAVLQQAEILLDMNRPEECLQALKAVPSDSLHFPDACVLQGRALLQQAGVLQPKGPADGAPSPVRETLRAAQAALRAAIQNDPALASTAARQAAYLTAVCQRELGDPAGALQLFSQLRAAESNTPERVAAGFQEAQLLQTLQRPDEAAAAYCRVLELIGKPEEFRNPWMTLAELGERVRGMFRDLREARQFSLAFELSQRAGSVLPEDQVLEMKAEIQRDWGRDMLVQSQKAEASASAALVRDGRQHLRRAARHRRRLSQLRVATPFYPEEVWESARCAMDGRDYRLAVEMLEEYIKVDPRGRQPQARTDLGEALLSLDRIEEAIAVLGDCLERYPRDVNAPRARLLTCQAYLAKGDAAAAQRMLEANLSGDVLTPASPEYEQSLFLLGRLLHRLRRYDEALALLEEVVERYPDAMHTIEARYWVADCHRQKAQTEKERLRADLVEASRAARLRRIEQELNRAIGEYRQMQQSLLKRQEAGPLSEQESLMLRNSYFFIGSAFADLNQFDAAVEAYSQAIQRYPGSPETLEALVQLAQVLYASNKPSEAQQAVDQARFLLARLKPDAPLEKTTIYDRSQWAARLDQLTKLP